MIYLSLSLLLLVYLIVVMPPIILVSYPICLSDSFEGYVIGVGVSFCCLIRYDCYCLMDDGLCSRSDGLCCSSGI